MSTPALHETGNKPLDLAWVRQQFPSLKLQVNGHPAAFLDGPAGTQVPKQVMDAIQNYFLNANANTCGAFETSRRNDATIASARAAMADFFNCDTDEVVFGQNMTTITFALSRAIARELKPGDEIVVTTLDHDANVAPWRALEEKGVVIRQAGIREADCTLDLDDLKKKITAKTKLVAVGYASNAVGTINPVAEITKLAHAAGALMFIDAVHYAPHGPIDVRALDCDFLACSPYKFFGPHMGTLYGKREHLLALQSLQSSPSAQFTPRPLGNRHASPGADRRNRRRGRLHRRTRPPLRSQRKGSPQRPAGGLSRNPPARDDPALAINPRSPRHPRPALLRHHRSRAFQRPLLHRLHPPRESHAQPRPRNSWAIAASSPGTATTTPSISPNASASNKPAASSASAWSITTPPKKSTAS